VIDLLDVETRRYLARRITRVLVLVGLIGIVLVAILVFVNASDVPGEEAKATELWKDGSDPGILDAFAMVWILFSFIVGASFVGAEWRAGVMTTLLTWEPRRARVFAAKASVAGGLGGGLVIALNIVVALALWPTFVLRGSTAGLDSDFWIGVLGVLLRGGVAGAALALVGFAVASIGRNTAAALAGVLSYFIVIESILRGLRPGWSRWLFLDNLAIVMTGSSGAADADFSRSLLGAGLVLTAWVGALVAGAAAAFLRRDVS
jgi:ABC-2 type transport system permease protein